MAVSAASSHNRSGSLFNGELLADYFQIHVRDRANADLPAAYSEEAIAARLVVGPHAAVVHTARNMAVTVIVEWHDVRPRLEIERYHMWCKAVSTAPPEFLSWLACRLRADCTKVFRESWTTWYSSEHVGLRYDQRRRPRWTRPVPHPDLAWPRAVRSSCSQVVG